MVKGFLTFFILTCSLGLFAQFENDDEYKNELIWGVTTNTNSGLIGGVVFRYARLNNDNLFETFGLEMVNVKHPSEQKYTSGQNGTSFIWGKQNKLFAIRGLYGRDKLLYKKESQKGVQINANIAAGPSIGLVIPYYVLTSGGEYVVYNPVLYPTIQSIQGAGKFLQGFGKAKIIPGLNAKAAIDFEFGSFKRNVVGIEFGIMAEAYIKEIVIIPTQPNRAVYTSAFFTFFWGKRN
ncbi:MAG: hypothetical protein HQ474_04390 [Flammeovirgaceae bacterium]|jgi:hypothetical protein|nr:hypothetical protein [Flammeovirgaceae bacterium]|tara:strand:+ start:53317 stop:54024 length:708 start_codon:yes stop_codon:yes gene_type:complete